MQILEGHHANGKSAKKVAANALTQAHSKRVSGDFEQIILSGSDKKMISASIRISKSPSRRRRNSTIRDTNQSEMESDASRGLQKTRLKQIKRGGQGRESRNSALKYPSKSNIKLSDFSNLIMVQGSRQNLIQLESSIDMKKQNYDFKKFKSHRGY